jgi:Eukaryotic aspartyl protease
MLSLVLTFLSFRCVGNFQLSIFLYIEHSPGPQWILGDTFMRQWYTVFNYVDETVGFAKAVRAA